MPTDTIAKKAKNKTSLTDLTAKKAKPREKQYRLCDQHGLYLQVEPSGAKYWRHNYRHHGKQKTLALGVYPNITLEAARKRHNESWEMLAHGVDPGAEKRIKRLPCRPDCFRDIAVFSPTVEMVTYLPCIPLSMSLCPQSKISSRLILEYVKFLK